MTGVHLVSSCQEERVKKLTVDLVVLVINLKLSRDPDDGDYSESRSVSTEAKQCGNLPMTLIAPIHASMPSFNHRCSWIHVS